MTRVDIPQSSADRRGAGEHSHARPNYENLVIRLFRGLKRWIHFQSTIMRGIDDLMHPAPIPDSGATPARYLDVTNDLELVDRPMPLTRFEQPVEGEAHLIGRMARLAANAVVENYCGMKSSDVNACAMRDQHAKTHGCVRAEFVVRDDLPTEFTTSLFQPGKSYPALLRFSNGQGTPQSDRKVDGRGLSIKLREVDGTTFLHRLTPARTGPGEHDFLFSSYPVFFCKDVIEYSEFMEAVISKRGTWRETLAWGWRWFAFIVRHPGQFKKFLATGFVRITNPLTATYHSMSPYLLGEDTVVRYLVTPETPRHPAAAWWSCSSPRSANFLREALVRDLRREPGRGATVLIFSVRVRDSATPQDVEDASLWWTRPKDRIVPIGRIRIEPQDFEAPGQLFEAERMMFSPWNSLPEHRPLGSINRMRLAVYLSSLQVRRKLNMVGP